VLRGSVAVAALSVLACAARGRALVPSAPPPSRVSVDRVEFHGWAAFRLENGVVEAVAVPAMGRVMRFALSGGGKTAFWSHPRLGPELAADENGWINFGGDKAWPAPQDGWATIAGKGWPPPRTFDQAPYTATVTPDGLELVSAVDPAYGVQVRRHIGLLPGRATMTIDTSFEKVTGAPLRMAVWTITQLASPERLAARLPERSAFRGGYERRIDAAPLELRVEGRLLSLGRDRAAKTMIGTDAEALLWIGAGPDLLIEKMPGDAGGGEWPNGAHAQIYTSPDDAEPYVELELLGRLKDLRVGDRARMTVRYTLVPRANGDPSAEAKRVFALP
jgi:hypothetical protein